jgi:hypothetical protein
MVSDFHSGGAGHGSGGVAAAGRAAEAQAETASAAATHGARASIAPVLQARILRAGHETDMLNPGDKAPDFTATDHLGRRVSLAELRGKTVVLWFYPKADTPG